MILKMKTFNRGGGYNKYPLTQAAFTLAEVLVTLAVIGVVAAMTIPNLVQSYKKKVYSTELKYFYSMMSQAIKLSEIDNGNVETWEKEPEVLANNNGNILSDKQGNEPLTQKYFDKYIKPYIKYTETTVTGYNNTNRWNLGIILANSSTVYMHNGGCMDFDILLDNKEPVYGQNVFKFVLCNEQNKFQAYQEKTNFAPFCSECNPTREALLEMCKTYPTKCAALLMYDGWEFKDDYPYKL